MGLVLSRIETFQEVHDVDSQTLTTATTIYNNNNNNNNNKRERNENNNNNNNNIDFKNHSWVTQGKKC